MRFVNPIAFVRDMNVSKNFYGNILGMRIARDLGNFVAFETGFAIHEGASLEETVWGSASPATGPYGRRNVLLYFEDDNLDALFGRISHNVEVIHPIEAQSWGQRVFRIYDPDGHAIEIGEPEDTS